MTEELGIPKPNPVFFTALLLISPDCSARGTSSTLQFVNCLAAERRRRGWQAQPRRESVPPESLCSARQCWRVERGLLQKLPAVRSRKYLRKGGLCFIEEPQLCRCARSSWDSSWWE